MSKPMARYTVIILAVLIELTLAPSILAQCPEAASDIQTPTRYELNYDGANVILWLTGEQLVLSIADSEVSRVSVWQENAGPPKVLIPLSMKRFAVIGPESAYLVPLRGEGTGLRLGTPERLPTRYETRCGFWAWLTGRCIISPARFSSALSAVIVTGWDCNGQFGAVAYRGSEAPVALISPQGDSLGYLWDDNYGHAVLRTRSGEAFTATRDGMSRCGRYSPLEVDSSSRTFFP
jgi:hypothetical protein